LSTVPPARQSRQPKRDPDRLPVRWALIGILASIAAAVGFICAGPVTAIVTGCAVATAAHRLIA
jgi:hypothetical protein